VACALTSLPNWRLQALKMIGIIAYRHPDARAFLSQQVDRADRPP
jgi:hypothetical protein